MKTAIVTVLVTLSLAACGGGGGNGVPADVLSDVPGSDLPANDLPGTDDVIDRDVPADGLPVDEGPGADVAAELPTDLPPADLLPDPGTTDMPPTDPGTPDVPADLGPTDPGPLPGEYPPSARGRYDTQQTGGNVVRGNRTTPVVAHGPKRLDGLPSPLIVFLPGFQAPSDLYQVTIDHLASHGFVVVRAEPPGGLFNVSHVEMAADAIAVIDWALDPKGPLGGRVDGTWIGMMGHSLGGKLATMVAFQDPRVKALFAIDPVNGGNPFTGYSATLPDIVPDDVATLAIPMGFPGETWSSTHSSLGQSCAPADQNYTTFYDAAAATPWKAKWEFPGADHMDFVDDLSACGTICSVCPDGTGDPKAQVAALRTLMTAFFRRHQAGETAMDSWLFGADLPVEAVATHSP